MQTTPVRNIFMGSLCRAPVERRRRERLVIQTFTSTTRRDGITALEGVRPRRSARETFYSFNE